ncbi:hypothetical protein ABL78_7390 [Leptomonas seymouri]|uniref:Uncharacterized protein n=1 Tax=Leptomonas seymouri TaxID=5684 RepID=A0A0N0P3E3_LEPSE|nr:hypothetical protein ABL78_7390 [Leptomonas seymouri]|eukprot:KPI83567.1 hypothetical protein ABL78_7390 [Leptomonas seymouri]
MLHCTRRFLFHIPRTPVGAAEARRVARGAPPSSLFQRKGASLRNGARDSAAEMPSAHTGVVASAHRSATSRHHRSQPGRTLRPGEPLPPPHESINAQTLEPDQTISEGFTSQRQAYRRQRVERERGDGSCVRTGVAGSYFTPLPRKYGFYDGLDAHALDTPQPSREERRAQLQASLESQAASVVEFTGGGESDIEMNGLPAEQYHGQAGWTTIPKDSALYNTMYGAGDLESRQRTNSWGVATRNCRSGAPIGDLLGESGVAPTSHSARHGDASGETGATQEALDDRRRRRRQHDESFYSTALEGELLAPMQESVGQPRSTYALRKMFIDGLVGYQGMISRAEEAAMGEELLHLLQSSRAAYIAEEARYCVNIYEKELGIPGKDTLAFALNSCPTLQRVLYRFFFLGLIPSVPNVCQVSEMVGNFSGYPVHRHPRSIGSYVGLLNLVSTSVLYLQHKDAPWYPRLHLTPRSLFVVTEPCLSEYAMGYKQTQQPFHAFEYATRVSKDYRIEVLFATVETAQTRTLSEAVQLTEYATVRMQEDTKEDGRMNALRSRSSSLVDSGNTVPNSGMADAASDSEALTSASLQKNTDVWLQQLRAKLHTSREGNSREKPIDGHALRRQLLAQHVVGSQPRGEGRDGWARNADARCHGTTDKDSHVPPSSSTETKAPSSAQRRLAALKTRFEFAQALKASKQQVEVSNSGPRLLRGHSPKDRHMGIK